MSEIVVSSSRNNDNREIDEYDESTSDSGSSINNGSSNWGNTTNE